jgi:hypothetical protein
VPTVGSFYPAPPWPVNLFPYLFLAFMLLGGARLYQMYRTQPGSLRAIQRDLERALDASARATAISEEAHHHHGLESGTPFTPPVPATMGSPIMTMTSRQNE